jgi:hypothetical protein
MINKDAIRKWVTALRSEKYPQSDSYLRTADGYCCLGVLCDISGLGEWSEPRQVPGVRFSHSYLATDLWQHQGPGITLLPPEVIKWAGFDTGNPVVYYDFNGISHPAAGVNDSEGLSFNEIADYLERTYL